VDEVEPPTEFPKAGGIELQTTEYEWDDAKRFEVTFPVAIVSDEVVLSGKGGPIPLAFEPPLPVAVNWFGSNHAEVRTTGPIPSSSRIKVTLDPGLTDINRQPVKVEGWEFQFSTPPFRLASAWIANETSVTGEDVLGEQKLDHPISREVEMEVQFTAAVAPAEVARTAWFQDADSRERIPAQVLLRADQTTVPMRQFWMIPSRPLPEFRRYELVFDGTLDAANGRPLPTIAVVPVGSTSPMTLKWVGAYNQPFRGPFIEARFSEVLDAASADPAKIKLDPPVKGLRVSTEQDSLIIEGDFDPNTRYKVTFDRSILGIRKVGLEKNELWGATFDSKRPTLAFPPGTQVFQTAAAGLDFSMLQVNTEEVKWQLAKLPPARAGDVEEALQAFEDPRKASPRVKAMGKTGSLIADLGLEVAASGHFPATAKNEEAVRRIGWRPANRAEAAPGLFLLEALAEGNRGRTTGNRIIISLGEYVVARKSFGGENLLRVMKMSDGQPGARLRVAMRDPFMNTLAEGITGPNGELSLPIDEKMRYVTLGEGPSAITQIFRGTSFRGTGSPRSQWDPPENESIGAVFTDRNLYRPGQTVMIKGIIRFRTESGGLVPPPAGETVQWKVERDGEAIVEGEAKLSPGGGWNASWEVPAETPLGGYTIRGWGASTFVQVEEFRPPLFSVLVEAQSGDQEIARAEVSSEYFHGAPNAGAIVRWKATWAMEEAGISQEEDGNYWYFQTEDSFSEQSPLRGFSYDAFMDFPKAAFNADALVDPRFESPMVQGEAVLGKDGKVTLECRSPFPKHIKLNRTRVYWEIDVTSFEGRSVTAGGHSVVQATPQILALAARSDSADRLTFDLRAAGLDDKLKGEVDAQVEVYLVRTKTAREEIAPNVARYRNSLIFEKVWNNAVRTPARVDVPIKEVGRYVVTARPASAPQQGLVSDEARVVSHEETEPAEFPVSDDSWVTLDLDREAYQPGDKAVVAVESPFAGLAWVSIETDHILDQWTVPLASNAGRIEVPIRPEYSPNAFVSVYLLKPGGDRGVPTERYGMRELRVERKDTRIEVKAAVQEERVEPGKKVEGTITLASQGKALAGAEVTVFAVDEAVLSYGEWSLPDFTSLFYPARRHRVVSFSALDGLVESFSQASLTQKGFIVGGGMDVAGNVPIRKDFRALAYWSAEDQSDAGGRVSFQFLAPESLTAYRIVAVAHSKDSRFGAGETQVQITKPLLIEPALPRFVRNGDEIELRAIVRQSYADQAKVRVKCALPSGGIELMSGVAATSEVSAARDVPAVVRFRARVLDAEAVQKVTFQAADLSLASRTDGVEATLPIRPPTLLVHRSVGGGVAKDGLLVSRAAPSEWLQSDGRGDILVSSSEWMPNLMGLPSVLDYPHGCFEQVSGRVLAFTMLNNLLAFLPVTDPMRDNYQERVLRGLDIYRENQLPSGAMPYWPGSRDANLFATVQVAWSLVQAQQQDFAMEPGVLESALEVCEHVARNHVGYKSPTFTRCFALMVLAAARPEQGADYADVAEELYLARGQLTGEGRALLALAYHSFNAEPEKQARLIAEIDPNAKPASDEFDPATFSSPTRQQAIIALAMATIEGSKWPAARIQTERGKLARLMDSSASLSSQENLWLLLAFHSLIQVEIAAQLGQSALPAKPTAVSENGATIAWLDEPLQKWEALFNRPLRLAGAETFLMRATYRGPLDPQPTEKGFRLTRTLINATEPKRDGSAAHPFQLGDEVLVTFRISTERPQSFVVLEDQLPACLETVNPNIAQIARIYRIPPGAEATLEASFAERRDDRTYLYFDNLPAGNHSYTVLARVSGAGTYQWPASQVVPMYDARFYGSTGAARLVAGAR
jgi:uncharacterized protein YfaS (alpha-2-macroglobulin family)